MDDRIRNYEQGVAEIETLTSIRSNLEVPATEYTPDESQPARDRVFTFAQEEEILSILGDIDTGVKNLVDKTNTNTENIAGNTADIATNTQAIATNASNIANNTANIATNTADIATNTSNIATNTQNISTNTADIATNAENIATNTSDIANNATDIEVADKRISNIEKLLQGNLYDYQTDDTSAYTKTVPAGAMPYAGIEKLGGKTLVWNQLNDNAMPSRTSGNITVIKDADNGTWTANGTEESIITYNISSAINYIAGHKYLLMGCPSGGSGTTFSLTATNLGATDNGDGTIVTCSTSNNGYVRIVIRGGYVASNLVFRPLLFDLTLMFGSGNEPTTVEQFREMFPADYYEYNSGELLSAGVTEVESVGKNLADISIVKAFYPSLVTIVSADEFTFVSSHSMSVTNRFFDNVEKRSGRMSISYSVKYNSATSRGVYLRVYYTDGSFDRLYNTAATNTWLTVSRTSSATKTVDCVAWSYENADVLATFKDLQIEWNSTATSYSPYKEISMPIPAEVRALEGYGWSAGTAYNYIDYERKVFVKRVGAVDLGTLTYSRGVSSASGLTYFDNHTITNKKVFPQNQPANLVCAKFIPTADNKSAPASSPYGVMYSLDTHLTLYADYPDVPTFQSAMSGVMLYYELATPIEVDISAYITDDNLIEVESGGTLTFPNSNGDDYRIPVPSEETYMINLQEAVSNG